MQLDRESTPRVEVAVRHDFTGHVLFEAVPGPAVSCTVRHGAAGSSRIFIELASEDDWSPLSRELERSRPLAIRTSMPYQACVLIHGVTRWTLAGPRAQLDALRYHVIPEGADLSPGDDVVIFAELDRKGALRTETSLIQKWDGTVEAGGTKRQPLELIRDGVKDVLTVRFVYAAAEAGTDRATVQIERPALVRTFRAREGQTWNGIMDELEGDLRDVTTLLSLCSRLQIFWYGIEIIAQQPGGALRAPLCVRRRVVPRREQNGLDPDPLIEHDQLQDGGLATLLERFRTSPFTEAIRRAILLETASWEPKSVEESLVLCHAALESIIGTFERDEPLLGAVGVPRRELKEAAEAFVASLPATIAPSPEARRLISEKVPEFIRPAIARVVEHHVARTTVRTYDLWPIGTSFADGLRAALKLRNDLVHGSGIADPAEAVRNTTRLRVLAERLILHQLGWNPDRVGHMSDEPLARINR